MAFEKRGRFEDDLAMPLELPDRQHLAAAEGFLALGMCDDANSELEEIDPFCRRLPEVLAVRLGIYQQTKRWEMAQVVAKQLATDDSSNPQWLISLAYATRRLESLEPAKAILLDAVSRHPKEPIIHYNLACYDCQMGHLESAKDHLKRAFDLAAQCRAMALDDPDLKPLWKSLKSELLS